MEAFSRNKADGFDQFYDEKTGKPRYAFFIAVFAEFLLYAIAQEIRALIGLVNGIYRQGDLILPKFRGIRRTIQGFFKWDVYVGESPADTDMTPSSPRPNRIPLVVRPNFRGSGTH